MSELWFCLKKDKTRGFHQAEQDNLLPQRAENYFASHAQKSSFKPANNLPSAPAQQEIQRISAAVPSNTSNMPLL